MNVILFMVLTFFVSLLLSLSSHNVLNALAQAVPAFIAVSLILLSKNRQQEFYNLGVTKLGNLKWYLVAIFLPFIVIVTSYSVASVIQCVAFTQQITFFWVIEFFGKFLLFTIMWPFIWAFGEEIGWRGYLQPKLIRLFGVSKGIILTSIIWAVWHYIFIFFDGYYNDGNLVINTALFTITIILMSFSIGIIRVMSQSIWPCVIFHSASNAIWQFCSYNFKVLHPNYIYIAGEAGVVNIVMWALIALLIINNFRFKHKIV